MSERVERLENISSGWDKIKDETLAKKIWTLLGSPADVFWNDCDAMYFDYSVIPSHACLSRDAYFLFGINNQAQLISIWIDRWEFDKN